MSNKWLDWGLRIQGIAQSGLTYCENQYDIDRYCKLREIAAEIMADGSGHSRDEVIDFFLAEKGYATPKIDVRGVVFRDDKILLVKEMVDGGWTLPGGWADIGDAPSEAVEREILEESGYEAKAAKVLAVFDRNKHPHPLMAQHIYKIFILCELTGGEARTSFETLDVGWFAEDEIPPLSAGRTTPQQITRLFEHHRSPDLPADFD